MIKTVWGLFLVLALSAFIFWSSCTKEKECTVAGTGGDVTLILQPQHHGNPIYGSASHRDTAFIKFNTSTFPGGDAHNYDLMQIGNAGEDFVKVPGLKCGQYVIFIDAYDTSAAWHIRVLGGIPLYFTETSGEKTVVVPVTE